jgi:hypothetical protein
MASDALLSTVAPGIKTSTFSTSPITLPKSVSPRPLWLRVVYTAAANASGANAIVFDCDASYDAGSTYSVLSSAAPINLSTTAQAGELFLPVQITRQDLISNQTVAPLVRLTGTFSGAGGSPTINVTSVEFTTARA